jgi:hypothetical protein
VDLRQDPLDEPANDVGRQLGAFAKVVDLLDGHRVVGVREHDHAVSDGRDLEHEPASVGRSEGPVQRVPVGDLVEVHLVQHDVAAVHELLGAGRGDPFGEDVDVHVPAELVGHLGHHLGLVAPERLHAGAQLSLDVRHLEVVRVCELQVPGPHAHEPGCDRPADPTGTGDPDDGISQLLLPGPLLPVGLAQPSQAAVDPLPVQGLVVLPPVAAPLRLSGRCHASPQSCRTLEGLSRPPLP